MTEDEVLKNREYKRNWYRANKEKAQAAARKSYAANIEKQRERGRKKYAANREKYMENSRRRRGIVDSGRRKGVRQPEYMKYVKYMNTKRNAYLKKSYGITLEEWGVMFEKQNGRCAICGISSQEFWHSLCVDHDHKTGRVRGLLCRRCNAALGNLQDDVSVLQKAIVYLQS